MTTQAVVNVADLSKTACSNYLLANRYLFSDFIGHNFSSYRKTKLRQDEFLVLDSISFSAHKGEKIGVTGFSKTAQSLLGRILAGLAMPTTGSVKIAGKCVYVAKPSAGFKSFLSVAENAKLRLAAWGETPSAISKLIPIVLKTADLKEKSSKLMINCSNEEIRSLAYALLIVYDADIYILDDFFPWLKTNDTLAQQLQNCFLSKTVFFIGAAEQIASMVDKVLILENGKITHEGPLTAEICKYMQNSYVHEKKPRAYLPEADEESFAEPVEDSEENSPASTLQIEQIMINEQDFQYPVTCLLARADQKTSFTIDIKALKKIELQQIYLQIHSRFNPIPFTREPLFNSDFALPLAQGEVRRFHFEILLPAMHRGVYGLALETKLRGSSLHGQDLHKVARFGILSADIRGDGLAISVSNAAHTIIPKSKIYETNH